jgi:hypothetical protein
MRTHVSTTIKRERTPCFPPFSNSSAPLKRAVSLGFFDDYQPTLHRRQRNPDKITITLVAT